MPPPGKPDIDPPKLRIRGILEGDTLRDTTGILFEVEDKSPLKWVRLLVDRSPVLTDSVAPFELFLDPFAFPDTLHTLQIEAADTWDNIGRSPPLRVYFGVAKEEKRNESKGDSHP